MIYEKLSLIQKNLFVPKDRKNDFGKYNYRSCEDILKAVKPLCEANKAVLTLDTGVKTCGDEIFIVAEAILRDLEDGSEISVNGYAKHEKEKKGMDGSQISGSATSYARKYALAGLFGIDNEKDSDATNDTPREEEKPVEKKANEVKVGTAHVNTLKSEIRRRGLEEKQILDYFRTKAFEDFNMEQFNKAIAMIQKYKVKGEEQ